MEQNCQTFKTQLQSAVQPKSYVRVDPKVRTLDSFIHNLKKEDSNLKKEDSNLKKEDAVDF
jgi:hypothetical protein